MKLKNRKSGPKLGGAIILANMINYRKTLFNSPPMNENSTIFLGGILLIPMSFLENSQISRGELIME